MLKAFVPAAPTPPVLAPGVILQFLYLRERLRRLTPGSFVEVGPGAGDLSAVLLAAGWSGVGYEPGPAASRACLRNAAAIAAGRYDVRTEDWLTTGDGTADLVVSAMVVEHLPEDQEAQYFERARETLRPGGRVIVLVPAGPRYWGIEDDVAGHQRRYTRASLARRLRQLDWRLDHIAGLTFPLSNILLPISNRLVAHTERDRLGMTELERTLRSGNRDVRGKTSFPAGARVVLNERALTPLHLLQKLCSRTDRALVLYGEATPLGS